MARIRTLPPEVATDPKLATVSLAAAHLAVASWPWHDDHGWIAEEPARIRMTVYPGRPDVDDQGVADALEELVRARWFERYRADDKPALWCTEWATYQRVDRPGTARFPDHAAARDAARGLARAREGSSADREGDSRMVGGDGRMVGESGAVGGNGAHAPAPEPAPAPPPRVALPRHAQRLLDELYAPELATERRRADVAQQLYDTLDPLRPKGARIEKGRYARARDAAHLDQVCKSVLEDPPRLMDMAIRIVLLRLTDPPKVGADNPTESAARAARDEETAVQEYERRLGSFAARWVRDNPEEAEALEREVRTKILPLPYQQRPAAELPAHFALVLKGALAAKIREASGAPTFEAWREKGASAMARST